VLAICDSLLAHCFLVGEEQRFVGTGHTVVVVHLDFVAQSLVVAGKLAVEEIVVVQNLVEAGTLVVEEDIVVGGTVVVQKVAVGIVERSLVVRRVARTPVVGIVADNLAVDIALVEGLES